MRFSDLLERKKQLDLLDNFGKNLKICFFTPNSFKHYQHWYVTDGKWVMKFGKEDQIKEYLGRTKDGKVVALNFEHSGINSGINSGANFSLFFIVMSSQPNTLALTEFSFSFVIFDL